MKSGEDGLNAGTWWTDLSKERDEVSGLNIAEQSSGKRSKKAGHRYLTDSTRAGAEGGGDEDLVF